MKPGHDVSTATMIFLLNGFIAAAIDPSSLGPGPNAWQHGDPADHGLDPVQLAAAAERIRDAVPHRWCFVAVKDGVIVQENYFHNDSSTKYRTQSLGKTMIASLMGVPASQGLLDIDRPLHEYGLKDDAANWSVFGTNWFPNVTTKHLLGQSSGYGMVQPGTKFTYDSNDYIQYLSYTLGAVTGKTPVEFATKEFAEPMGFPDMFKYDGQIYDIGGNISTGGGQMMTCRDVARVGTLIVNKGMWRDASGAPMRLVSADYMEKMSNPSFPEYNVGCVNKCWMSFSFTVCKWVGAYDRYGFLTWLNHPVNGTGPHCCGPRWSSSKTLLVNQTSPDGKVLIGTCCSARNDSTLPAPPCNLSETRTLSETGQSKGKMLIEGSQYISSSVIDDNTPAGLPRAPYDLMMGQGANGQYIFISPSLNLSVVTMGMSRPSSRDCSIGYDDAFLVSLAWNAIAPAFDSVMSEKGSGSTKRTFKPSKPAKAQSTQTPDDKYPEDTIAGSCMCDCPPDLGFGRCFNVPRSAVPTPPVSNMTCNKILWNSNVSLKIRSPAKYCPRMGKTIGCDPTRDTNASELCTLGPSSKKPPCNVINECKAIDGMAEAFAVATCDCPPMGWTGFRFNPCVWSTSPCKYSPYYPLG